MISQIRTEAEGSAPLRKLPGVCPLSRTWRILVNTFCLLLAASHGAQSTSPTGVAVQPASLSLNAMVNEPVVLQLEVSGQSDLGDVDLKAQGIRIQREIKKPAANRRVFWIEPDTSTAGRINGSIAVVDRQGNVLSTVSVNGDVKPHVRVSPSRLFLGSLEYGTTSGQIIERRFRLSTPGDWKVTHIDTSEIPSAEHELTDLGPGAKELRLRFPEDALKAGEPFGAFVNRTIRIQTDVVAQPDVDMPVTAMLSKNGTKRTFNTFVFKGNERWQGKWATPNIAGAVLGPLLLLAIGYGIWLSRIPVNHPIFVRSVAAVLCASSVFGMLLLAKTYSRGGWLAFGIGLTAMFVLMKGARRRIAAAGAIFALIVILSPAGVQRAASASEVGGDASIRNRLLVWRGALEMISDHPIAGVGAGGFGQVFEDFYQEPWHKPSYSTAINDYLTFAAERGLVITLPLLAIVVFIAAAATQINLRHHDEWVAPGLCALFTIATSSLFSSIEFVGEVRFLALTITLLLIVYGLFRTAFYDRFVSVVARPIARKVWMQSTAISGAAVCLSGGIVWLADATRAVRYVTTRGGSVDDSALSSLTYIPEKLSSRGTVLFLPQERQPLEVTGRRILRPLAQKGLTAICLVLPEYDQEATAFVAELIDKLPHPLLILAEKSKARIGLGAVQRARNGFGARLAFAEPMLFSALLECNKSHEGRNPTLQITTLDERQWETFKRDSRSLGREFADALSLGSASPEPASSAAVSGYSLTSVLSSQPLGD